MDAKQGSQSSSDVLCVLSPEFHAQTCFQTGKSQQHVSVREAKWRDCSRRDAPWFKLLGMLFFFSFSVAPETSRLWHGKISEPFDHWWAFAILHRLRTFC